MTNEDYRVHASEELDMQTMEALAAESEQGVDMDQPLRHSVYVGWVLAMARNAGINLDWPGGNTLVLSDLPNITLVIPYPPEDWTP